MLSINNISKSYNRKVILKNINIDINIGEIIGILGPNGVGKTTLLKIISNIIKQDKGNIIFNKKVLENNKIYTIFDNPDIFYKQIKVIDNLYYFGFLKGIKRSYINTRLKEKQFQFLKKYLNVSFGKLSLGEKKSVIIAVAVLFNPKILCLDEPSNGLDILHSQVVINLLKNFIMDSEHYLIISSHDLIFLEQLVNRYLILKNGEIIIDSNDIINMAKIYKKSFEE